MEWEEAAVIPDVMYARSKSCSGVLAVVEGVNGEGEGASGSILSTARLAPFVAGALPNGEEKTIPVGVVSCAGAKGEVKVGG